MKALLIPGFWLDKHSWGAILPALRQAGVDATSITLPGVGVPQATETLADWVAAVVAVIDTSDEPIVLVGHSGGGNVAWGAAAQRPDRVARVVFVDAVPPHPGASIGGFAAENGVVPFPGWAHFPAQEVADLSDEVREVTASRALSIPAAVVTDPIELDDESRFSIPVTLLMGSLGQEEFDTVIGHWGPFEGEYRALREREVVRIGSGHWPQFSVPERLTELLIAAIR